MRFRRKRNPAEQALSRLAREVGASPEADVSMQEAAIRGSLGLIFDDSGHVVCARGTHPREDACTEAYHRTLYVKGWPRGS